MRRGWLGRADRARAWALGLASGVTALMLVALWLPSPLLRLESLVLDLRFKIRGPRAPTPAVVLVAVDEKSLAEIGRWPWSRGRQAELIEKILADEPKVVGLDIIYAEPERDPLASPIGERVSRPDRRLEESLARARRVVLAVPFLVPETDAPPGRSIRPAAPDSGALKGTEFMIVKDSGSHESLQPYLATAVQLPLPALAGRARSLGHVYNIPDRDGVTRYEYLTLRYGEDYYPSFSLELARVFLDLPRERMVLHLGAGVQLGERFLPTDQRGRLVIDFLGRERSFPYVSAADVLHGRIPAGTFRGKAVIVGTAALGTYDQKITPFSNNFPGFEKNATVLDNILTHRIIRKTMWSSVLDPLAVLLFGAGLGLLLPRLPALAGAMVALGAFVGYAAFGQVLFEAAGIWLDTAAPLLTIALTFVAVTVLQFMVEERQIREIRTMFSSYVNAHVVEELIKDPDKAATVGGQRRELTLLFADLVSFTRFAEQHAAEQVVGQLNEYLAAMTEVVFRWNGTLDKFVGDGILAFWGAPLDQPNHVELAVKCALHMQKRLGELQAQWRSEGKVPFTCGIGINTGPVIVGKIGAPGKKMDYTAVGDHVNLAARVEGLTRTVNAAIVVTEHTVEKLKPLIDLPDVPGNQGRLGHVHLSRLGAVRVKGRDRPVVVYTVQTLALDAPSRIEEGGEPGALDHPR